VHAVLGEVGWEVNRKRVARLWREEGQLYREIRRKPTPIVPASRLAAERANHVWALDYQHDQTASGGAWRLYAIDPRASLGTGAVLDAVGASRGPTA
jgi:transposase InsO family protein